MSTKTALLKITLTILYSTWKGIFRIPIDHKSNTNFNEIILSSFVGTADNNVFKKICFQRGAPLKSIDLKTAFP